MESSMTSRRKDSNNDFLETPHTNRKKLKEKQKLSQDIKAKYIQQLEERNRKLKYEIIKINQMLEQQKEVPKKKKEHKLIPNDSTAEVAKKELQNVYKQIKNYQRQIHTLQTKQSGGLISDKMARLENIYEQKTTHLQKLKTELSILTKASLDNQKKLKNNAGRQQLENQMLKYNEQIKLLRDKVREADQRQKKKMQNAKKQYDYIKKLEKELIENGVTIDQLQELKRNNIYNQIYEKMNNREGPSLSPNNKSRVNKVQQLKEEIQQITVDRYLELTNDLKLHKKLHQDYTKRLEGVEKEKLMEEKATQQTKDKLKQKQTQIDNVQTEINDLRAKIKKSSNPHAALKASQSSQKKKPIPKQRILPPKKPEVPPTNSATDQTHLKYDEKGQVSQRSARFTDRAMLGKNFASRIVSIKVWTEKSTFQISGIQCFYKINGQIRAGAEHILKDCKPQCTQNLMQLPDGDHVKAISGNLSQNNIIQYLVVISKDAQIGRFGVVKPTQKQFNFDIDDEQIPICMYGSLQKPLNKGDCSLIDQIGFEIARDKNYIKEDKFI